MEREREREREREKEIVEGGRAGETNKELKLPNPTPHRERRDETKAKLFALQERWQRDLEEERRQQEERKRIEENKRAKQLLAIREKKAVAKIERWYKGILIARAKAGAGKKKKKGSKKKKKKKK